MRAFGVTRAIASILLLAAQGAGAHTVENVTFPTNVVPKTSNDRPVQVKAKLFLPDSPKLRVSAVVISPSSGGVRQEREIYYAEELAKAGIAALVVDSFASRGLTNSVHDQSSLTSWQSGNDAVAALA